jgi:hypothetical protein
MSSGSRCTDRETLSGATRALSAVRARRDWDAEIFAESVTFCDIA